MIMPTDPLQDAIDRLNQFKLAHKFRKPWVKHHLSDLQVQQIGRDLERQVIILKLKAVREKNAKFLSK